VVDVTKENTIFDVLKERLTSPISGGFIIIWLVHNWDYSLKVLSKNFTTENQYLEVSSEVMDSYRRVSSTSLRDIEEKLINCIGIVRRIMKSDKKDGGN
jgi:hypothetical protein